MTVYRIPVDITYPSTVQETTLDGTTYRLLFRWNARDGYWYLTIRDLEDGEIAPSRRLVPGSSLLRLISDLDLSLPGRLILYGEAPGRDDLDSLSYVIYLDETTVEELTA